MDLTHLYDFHMIVIFFKLEKLATFNNKNNLYKESFSLT